MAVRIIATRKSSPPLASNEHLSLQEFKWINEQTQENGESPRNVMYDWIVNKKGQAYVRDASGNTVLVYGAISPTGTT